LIGKFSCVEGLNLYDLRLTSWTFHIDYAGLNQDLDIIWDFQSFLRVNVAHLAGKLSDYRVVMLTSKVTEVGMNLVV
jgi:hypothetical protein